LAEYPLLATPCANVSSRQGENSCYSPFLLPTPQQTSTPGIYKLLQESFSEGYVVSSTSSSKSYTAHTPRVCFKDQLTEKVDLHNDTTTTTKIKRENEETPFTNELATTPGRSKNHIGLVTGSGPERIRGNATMIDDRDNLLSTAILATPKSPKMGNIQEIDQSLHHIDAYSMIKSPLNFGSPIMKAAARSPLR